MAWEKTDRDLITRCIENARTSQPVNSGQLSRFYKALARCPSLEAGEPERADVNLAVRALAVAGRPPLDTTPVSYTHLRAHET